MNREEALKELNNIAEIERGECSFAQQCICEGLAFLSELLIAEQHQNRDDELCERLGLAIHALLNYKSLLTTLGTLENITAHKANN